MIIVAADGFYEWRKAGKNPIKGQSSGMTLFASRKGYLTFGLLLVSADFRRSVSDGSSPKQFL
jgi:hypothetical protein